MVNVITSGINKNAGLTIKMASGELLKFGISSASNPSYAGKDFWNKQNPCASSISNHCPGSADLNQLIHHYWTEDVTLPEIEATKSNENIFYFNNPYHEYTLTKDFSPGTSCTYGQCAVIRGSYSVKLVNVDALIFPDKEIRPSN